MILNLEIEVTEMEAEALSQVLKRIGHSEIRTLSYDDEEAYNARYALEKIRKSLALQGYNPR